MPNFHANNLWHISWGVLLTLICADYEEDSMHSVMEIEEKIRQRYCQPTGVEQFGIEPDGCCRLSPARPGFRCPWSMACAVPNGHDGAARWSYGDLRAAGNRLRGGRGDRQVGSTAG